MSRFELSSSLADSNHLTDEIMLSHILIPRYAFFSGRIFNVVTAMVILRIEKSSKRLVTGRVNAILSWKTEHIHFGISSDGARCACTHYSWSNAPVPYST